MTDSSVHQNFLELLKQWIPEEEVDDFLMFCRKPLKKSITINTNKISVDEFLSLTKNRWRHLEPESFTWAPLTFYIDRDDLSLALWRTFLYQCWFFYIQEVAASLSTTQVDLKDWDIVLDMAAAPWGKTSQLANTLLSKEDVWMVVANDVNGQRLWTLAHNLNQWGRYNTFLTKYNWWSFGSNLPNFFDHVLLDAPCSWEWTWFKSDYAMKFWNQAEINKICGTQLQLLVSAIKTVKPWWTVVYSTCTLNPFENEGTLAKAFQFFGDSIELLDLSFQNLNEWIQRSTDDRSFDQKEKVSRCWPHIQKTGWFFIAKIRKINDPKNLTIRKDHKLLPRNQFKIDKSKWLQKKLAKRLDEWFGIKIDEKKHFFVATKEKAYLCSPTFKNISPQLNAEKMWIPIAKLDRLLWFRPTHHLGNMLGHLATKHVVHVSADQMQQYSEWKNIPLEELILPKIHPENRYLILQWEWYGMSIGKIVDDVVKNKFGK